MDDPFVMLAAGGTGGHLFPAQALAEALGRRGIAVELATDRRGVRYGGGFPARLVHPIASATLASKNPGAIAWTGITLTRGVAAAYKLFGNNPPSVVVGFGGYPSFPPVLAARMRGIPTLLHEQNAVLGRANRMLAKRVTAIATSFPSVDMLTGSLAAKSRFTGNPVRAAVIAAAATPYATPWKNGPLRLVVFGGSQGARFFSDAVPPALAMLHPSIRSRLSVVQQARPEDVDRVRASYAASGIEAEVAPFFKDLPERLASCHLVIGRSGASTVAELAVIGRPSIMVPLPHAIDNDQLKNAASLSRVGAGWIIQQADLTPERLVDELSRLASEPGILTDAAQAAKSLGKPDAVERLADLVVEMMQQPRAAA